MMKKAFVFILVTFVLYLSAHSQNCNSEDLSVAGFEHFSKAQMYIGNLEQGGHLLAIGELKALIQTDSLWCYEVYLTIAQLYEEISLENNGTKKLEYLNNAVLYYKKYCMLRPNNKDLLDKIAELEALVKELEALTLKNKINIEMVYVEGMLNLDTTDCIHSFYIGKYEITQAQWEAVMGSNPSFFRGPNLPVENILPNSANSNTDYVLFIQELNRITGGKYRIPTSKEWLYAARGGDWHNNFTYSGSNSPYKVGWIPENSSYRTHPVGEKDPNTLGIYDMTGNVAEITISQNNYGFGILLYGGSAFKRIGGNTIPATGEESCKIESHDAPYNSNNYLENWYHAEGYTGNYYLLSTGIRIVREIDREEMSENEKLWDYLIEKKKQRIRQSHHLEEYRIEEARKKRIRRDSYFPIIRMDKIWSDVNVGYDFEGEGMYMSATVSPGPIYASALITDKDTSFFSAGLKFRIINRFDILLGLSYTPQENLWGGDVGLHFDIDEAIDITGGAMFFQNKRVIPHASIGFYGLSLGVIHYDDSHIIPTFAMFVDKNRWEFNITSVYGFDFTNKSHFMGISGFVGPIFLGAHYQTDKSYHFSLGGMRTLFDSKKIGFHGALAYSSANKFGLDVGLTFAFVEGEGVEFGNASIGALIYKDKIIPTIGLGGGGGFGALGVAGLIAGMIWGGYKLYTEVSSHL